MPASFLRLGVCQRSVGYAISSTLPATGLLTSINPCMRTSIAKLINTSDDNKLLQDDLDTLLKLNWSKTYGKCLSTPANVSTLKLLISTSPCN